MAYSRGSCSRLETQSQTGQVASPFANYYWRVSTKFDGSEAPRRSRCDCQAGGRWQVAAGKIRRRGRVEATRTRFGSLRFVSFLFFSLLFLSFFLSFLRLLSFLHSRRSASAFFFALSNLDLKFEFLFLAESLLVSRCHCRSRSQTRSASG